jgi:hypothetical protein
LPLRKHLFRVVEPQRQVAAEGTTEEDSQPLSEAGVEEVRVDRDLVVDLRGVAAAIAPSRKGAGRHLMERGRHGIPLGVVVKTR